MPGLVNAHTHLELTGLAGVGAGLAFEDWILEVTSQVLSHEADFFVQGAASGALECLKSGVTAVADHSTFGVSPAAMANAGLRGRVYREIFCPDPAADSSAQLDAVAVWLKISPEGIALGLSNHAPYNAPPRALAETLDRFGAVPRSIHVCESRDEVSYIADGQGVMASRHRGRGFPIPAHGVSPVEYLDQHGYWKPGTLAVHLTQATKADLELLAARGCTAVFCPGSNLALKNGMPPIGLALRTGLVCGLGTDSAISSPKLDLFEEMRLAVGGSGGSDLEPVTESQALAMATSEGARAAGIQGAGSLETGSHADIIALELPSADCGMPLATRIVRLASRESIRAVWSSGERRV